MNSPGMSEVGVQNRRRQLLAPLGKESLKHPNVAKQEREMAVVEPVELPWEEKTDKGRVIPQVKLADPVDQS